MEKKKASLTLSSLAIVLIVAFIAVGIGVFHIKYCDTVVFMLDDYVAICSASGLQLLRNGRLCI